MDSPPSTNNQNQTAQPESLKPRTPESAAQAAAAASPLQSAGQSGKKLRRTYRPSHKATFIGLAAVVAILAINAAIIEVVLKKEAKLNLANKGQVTLSNADLNRLGINRAAIGDSNVQLTVAPDANFKGKVSVAGTTVISGQLTLNDKLSGTEANLSQLQAGKTALSELNVNGASTSSSLNLRKDLVVAGASHLQGPVTINQLLTVSNNVNISGNLSVGGFLSVNTFSVQNLNLRGHITTSGGAVSVSAGSALGSNGTVSVSGNDAAATISINIGAGASSGTLVHVSFANAYPDIPRVVISPVGVGGNFYITNLTSSGFSVAITSGLPPGGYRINFIALQ